MGSLLCISNSKENSKWGNYLHNQCKELASGHTYHRKKKTNHLGINSSRVSHQPRAEPWCKRYSRGTGVWEGMLKTLGWHARLQLCTSLYLPERGVPKPESPLSVSLTCGRPPEAGFNCGRSKKHAWVTAPCQPGSCTSEMALLL